MAVTNIPTITPLSRTWTHEMIASEVMVLTNTIDNEQVQLQNIRNHMNSQISYLVNLLNLSISPWYRITLTARLDNTAHASGLDWIDLDTALGGIIPSQLLLDVKRLSVSPTPVATDWIGNCTKVDTSEITQLSSRQNVQWRFSICWQHTGREILVYCGDNIQSPAHTPASPATADYNVTTQNFVIWGTRKPVLDDLLAVSLSTTYKANVDVPDQYIDLLIKMTQKKVIEQRRELIPTALEQEVNQGLVTLQQQLANELQFEAAEREKRKYGNPQRVPGTV